MTPDRLSEIKRRADAATEGPWYASITNADITCSHKENGEMTVVVAGEVTEEDVRSFGDDGVLQTFPHYKDRDFIAHSRQDVPDLVAEVERLQQQLSAANDEVERLKKERDEAKEIVQRVEQAFARRPALDDCKSIVEMAWKSADTCGSLDRKVCNLESENKRLQQANAELVEVLRDVSTFSFGYDRMRGETIHAGELRNKIDAILAKHAEQD